MANATVFKSGMAKIVPSIVDQSAKAKSLKTHQ